MRFPFLGFFFFSISPGAGQAAEHLRILRSLFRRFSGAADVDKAIEKIEPERRAERGSECGQHPASKCRLIASTRPRKRPSRESRVNHLRTRPADRKMQRIQLRDRAGERGALSCASMFRSCRRWGNFRGGFRVGNKRRAQGGIVREPICEDNRVDVERDGEEQTKTKSAYWTRRL